MNARQFLDNIFSIDPGKQPQVADEPADEEALARALLADDPPARLVVVDEKPRRGRQLAGLDQQSKGDARLRWKYHRLILHRLDTPATEPLGDDPPQPEPLSARRDPPAGPQGQSRVRGATEVASAAPPPNLILFQVLVALEWDPDQDYLRRLKWAFRNASDFLYDVTNGRMAFGLVRFLDKDFVDCADIQIMASNQFHPRSWTGGLNDEEKYMPIRLGRGLWHQRNRVVIAWDEPEAYRTIIHEWAHYALGLKDLYLEVCSDLVAVDAIKDRKPRLANVHPHILVRPEPDEVGMEAYTVVVQRISEARESVMATLAGTSELTVHVDGGSATRRRGDLAKIDEQYEIEGPQGVRAGPGRLPLPLPRFESRIGHNNLRSPSFPARSDSQEALFNGLLNPFPLDRCRVYVVRDLKRGHPQLIAQGTLDARTEDDDFALLGAGEDDTVVLIADPRYRQGADRQDLRPIVRYGRIVKMEDGETRLDKWEHEVDTTNMPMIDVLPDAVDRKDRCLASVKVRVTEGGDNLDVHLFQLGEPEGHELNPTPGHSREWVSDKLPKHALDGHVLVRWGKEREHLMISTFSQGGGPPSHDLAPVPISGGSSDGMVMLFFKPQADDSAAENAAKIGHDRYCETQVITTIDNGAVGKMIDSGKVGPLAAIGARPWSYPFTLASNKPLPQEFEPTLVVHYATPHERDLLVGDLLICRLDGDTWRPQPTYVRAGVAYAATPLSRETPGVEEEYGEVAGVVDADPAPFTRRYQLYWIPRS